VKTALQTAASRAPDPKTLTSAGSGVHECAADASELTWQDTTWKLPLVSVPVLSKLTIDTWREKGV
jgi:hypothetical protein